MQGHSALQMWEDYQDMEVFTKIRVLESVVFCLSSNEVTDSILFFSFCEFIEIKSIYLTLSLTYVESDDNDMVLNNTH